jgi:hypothetical protein
MRKSVGVGTDNDIAMGVQPAAILVNEVIENFAEGEEDEKEEEVESSEDHVSVDDFINSLMTF